MPQANFTHDASQQRITITRRYNATRSRVWKAWTDSALLDQWWGPLPWRAVTKSFDFSEGGHWLYCMTGPNGEAHWALATYHTIDPENAFTATDCFCDAEGNRNMALPANKWSTRCIDHLAFTEVVVTIDFESPADMRTIVEMGFEEGFAAGLDQLQELLQRPKSNTTPATWRIQINAPRDRVWSLAFDKEAYTEWTAAFSAGSYYVGKWAAGEVIRFLAPGEPGAQPGGMVSVVREFRPPEYCSIEHLGTVTDGCEDLSSEAVLAWSPAFKNYTLKATNPGTEFSVDMNVQEEYRAMFEQAWPQALAILKQICERQV